MVSTDIFVSGDFINNPLADLGFTTVSRTPVTKTLTGNGDEILTEGTPGNIQAVVMPRKPQDIQTEAGIMEVSPAYIMVAPTQSLNKDDIIEATNGKKYRCLKPITRGIIATIDLYRYADLVFLGDV